MAIDERIDRSEIHATTLDRADAEDVEYWMTRSPEERIEALEYLRRWLYRDDQVDARLQRVFEIGPGRRAETGEATGLSRRRFRRTRSTDVSNPLIPQHLQLGPIRIVEPFRAGFSGAGADQAGEERLGIVFDLVAVLAHL